jgi:malate dehydrogenase (oxaloacetate-decarboxylating)
LGGVDAFPICLKTNSEEEIVRACELLEPSFGGINLEDIEKPKCFYVLEKARENGLAPYRVEVWESDTAKAIYSNP